MRYEYVVNDYYVTHEWRLIEYLLKLLDVSILLREKRDKLTFTLS